LSHLRHLELTASRRHVRHLVGLHGLLRHHAGCLGANRTAAAKLAIDDAAAHLRHLWGLHAHPAGLLPHAAAVAAKLG